MDEQKIRQIIRQEIDRANSESRFQLTMTNRHTHNGIDTPKISAANIVPSLRASGSITFAESNTYTLALTFNPSAVLFYGLAVRKDYRFTVTSASATQGATYTNNGQTFTVMNTISSGTLLTMTGSGAPASSGTLTKSSGTGDSSITFSSFSSSGFGVHAHCVGNAQLGPSFYFQPSTNTSVKLGGPIQDLIQSSSMFLVDTSVNPPIVQAITDEEDLVDVEYSPFGIVARARIIGFDPKSITITTEISEGWEIIGDYVVT